MGTADRPHELVLLVLSAASAGTAAYLGLRTARLPEKRLPPLVTTAERDSRGCDGGGPENRYVMVAGCLLAGVLLWWVGRESVAAGGVEHSTSAWIGIGLAGVCMAVGLVNLLTCALVPVRLIVANRNRSRHATRGAWAVFIGSTILVFLTREVQSWPVVMGAALSSSHWP